MVIQVDINGGKKYSVPYPLRKYTSKFGIITEYPGNYMYVRQDFLFKLTKKQQIECKIYNSSSF